MTSKNDAKHQKPTDHGLRDPPASRSEVDARLHKETGTRSCLTRPDMHREGSEKTVQRERRQSCSTTAKPERLV